VKITILIDTSDSFFHEYISEFIDTLKEEGHEVLFIISVDDIQQGDILFLLGCKTILSSDQLQMNKQTVVIHPSKLPKGRGSAALIWKILEGENIVYITLFEADEKIDSGKIYFQEKIELSGHELSDEIRYKQAMKSFDLIKNFLNQYPKIKGRNQDGKPTYYQKRFPRDSELDIDKTIRQQFNLLRAVDNNRYPAFFFHKGKKYVVKIYKVDD
jgi:methionyl-tRNA formyltransferase